MKDFDENLFKNLETYSNAIVGFSVIQGLVYLYYFGSNIVFNCHVKSAHYLAGSLTFVFILVGLLASFALIKIGRYQSSLGASHVAILKSISYSKLVVSLIFFILPATVTLFYGALKEAPQVCQKLIG